MGLTLKKEKLKNLPNAPKDSLFELSDLSLTDGWSKGHEGRPSFSIKILTVIHKKINSSVLSKPKKVKKDFH